MAEKITYLTPTGIISDTFREEFPRAKRWSDKLFANRREYQDKQAEMVEQANLNRRNYVYPEAQTYTSQAGNQWMINRLYRPNKDYDGRTIEYIQLCMMYGLTEQYFWVVTCFFENDNKDFRICLFTPHFIQRFYQRVGLDTSVDRMKVLRNLQESLYSFEMQVTEKKDGKRGYISYGRLPGCVCYGFCDKNRALTYTTIIPDNQMSNYKKYLTRNFCGTADFVNSTQFSQILSECFWHERPCKWFKEKALAGGMSRKTVRNEVHFIGCHILMHRIKMEYAKAAHVYETTENKEAIEEVWRDFRKLFIETPMQHHFDEYIPGLRKVVHSLFENVDEGKLNQAINAMKEICGDHYVSYDMYHVPAMPEKFVNKIKIITI